jgi:metal-responsive CopG/Arc/MetJ family transcriptional regulator
MMVSLRLKDELIAEIDRVASAHGQTRSAWIASTLARSVLEPANDSLPILDQQGRASRRSSPRDGPPSSQ